MNEIAVLGAGAFGTALAIALSRNGPVTLWSRDGAHVAQMQEERENRRRLPGAKLPEGVRITDDIGTIGADVLLLAIPMQQTGAFLAGHADSLRAQAIVACSKGIDLKTGQGPTSLIAQSCPGAIPAVLTGPSFAADIARGLPTALTLACSDGAAGEGLQERLSTPVLRLYRTTDVIGAELGGALKNVIAIGAGLVIGARLGDSARAALMTRGYAEMTRLSLALGARAETLSGLCGFGDLVLTCTSGQSRNFSYGVALGSGAAFDASTTVEGVATARAVLGLSRSHGVDMPVTEMVAAVTAGSITVAEAAERLLTRPLKEE